jgi:hypothetical protein
MIPPNVVDRRRPLIRQGPPPRSPAVIRRPSCARSNVASSRRCVSDDAAIIASSWMPSTAGAPRRERGLGVRLGTMLGGDDLTETRAREREQHRREQRLRIAMRARGARRDAAQAGRAAGVPWQARRRDRSQALPSSSVASGARGRGATVEADLGHAAFVRDVGARRWPAYARRSGHEGTAEEGGRG